MSALTQLAQSILERSQLLDEYVAADASRSPVSVETDSLANLPKAMERQRQELQKSAQLLQRLAAGPTSSLLSLLFCFTDILSLRFVHHFNIPKHVPLGEPATFEAVAASAGLDATLTRRMLQHVITNGIFQQPAPGVVSHTAISRMLATDPEAMDGVGFLLNDMHPAAGGVIEALDTFGYSPEPSECGFNVAFRTNDSFYIELAKNAERTRQFGGGMRWMTRGPVYDIQRFLDIYDWQGLDRPGAKVVDVGGGHGGVSRALAQNTKDLNMVVQDLPETVREGALIRPEEFRGRVEFMAHDFLTVQPVHGADVYLFRFILHNWSDQYVHKILQNLIPAMKNDARVLIYEFLLPETASTDPLIKPARNLDMISLAAHNSQERTLSDWERIFASVDSRFELVGTKSQEGSAIALTEVRFVSA